MLSKNCCYAINGLTYVEFDIPEMRVPPTFNNVGALQTRTLDGNSDIGGTSVYAATAIRKNQITVGNTNNLIVSTKAYMMATYNYDSNGSYYLELDADIY
jgi:hypothetical protein